MAFGQATDAILLRYVDDHNRPHWPRASHYRVEQLAAPVVAEAAPSPSREERIRVAAYLRYQSRGSANGDSLQDWVEAEAEVDRQAA